MKICVVTTWPPHRDGIAYYSKHLYENFPDRVNIKILANTKENSNRENISIKKIWNRGELFYPIKIFREIRKEKPDIVHFQHGWLLYGDFLYSILFLFLFILLKIQKIPIVTTMHTIVKKNANILNNAFINNLLKIIILLITQSIVRLSNITIVHNIVMKESLIYDYNLSSFKSKIIIIPHGVRKPHNIIKNKKDNTKIILSMGFIRDTKDFKLLIDAFKKFQKFEPNSKLIIAGGNHAHDKNFAINKLLQLIKKDNLKNIILTDFIEEKKLDYLISIADIVALFSKEDNFIETSGILAMVADFQKPIVCSNVTKFESELVNNTNCVMIMTENSDVVAKIFKKLIEDRYFSDYISKNLKNKFQSRYWPKVAHKHLETYLYITNKIFGDNK